MNKETFLGLCLLFSVLIPGSGCAPTSVTPVTQPGHKAVVLQGDELVPRSLAETPVAQGADRSHEFANCQWRQAVPQKVENYLGTSSELFRHGSGSDGMIELEMALSAGWRHPLILFTLGQLYLMAGQGEPDLLPVEGPAKDVGNWGRNQKRLLGRAQKLLLEAAEAMPDDGAVDYLLADVARAKGDFAAAEEKVFLAGGKCLGGRTFQLMRMYQQLFAKSAKLLSGDGPTYPEEALRRGISGPVELDVLVSPRGEIRQAVVVSSPGLNLSQAAAISLYQSYFQPGKIGKYAVWSWLRVTTNFNITGETPTGS